MRLAANIFADHRGAAAAELILVLPILLIIMMGSFELGNYFRSEHVLVEGLRNGARYAARQPFGTYTSCGSTAADVPSSVKDNTKLVVRKGRLNNSASDLLPKWDDGSTTFTVQMKCDLSATSPAVTGIYKGMTSGAPVVIVSAHLPYRSVLGNYGFTGFNLSINGTEQAAVTGI